MKTLKWKALIDRLSKGLDISLIETVNVAVEGKIKSIPDVRAKQETTYMLPTLETR